MPAPKSSLKSVSNLGNFAATAGTVVTMLLATPLPSKSLGLELNSLHAVAVDVSLYLGVFYLVGRMISNWTLRSAAVDSAAVSNGNSPLGKVTFNP